MSERERLLALQRILLPSALPKIGCTEAAAGYRAHNHDLHVGGDWYDLVDLEADNRIVAIVGDVVGHGVEQIAVMGQLRAASNALARSCERPHELLAALDGFARDVRGAAMATLVVLAIDGTTTARLASAGHLPPLHVTTDGALHIIEAGRRPPLTIEGRSATATFTFTVGDVIVLYTDGVVERRGAAIDDGIAALGRFIRERRHFPCGDLVTAILDDFGTDADDDMAVMALRPLHQRSADYQFAHRHTPELDAGTPEADMAPSDGG
ncbi:MAG: PP2C family protein-serine/threonine phosphatase [Acidimicrobiales bacterium]